MLHSHYATDSTTSSENEDDVTTTPLGNLDKKLLAAAARLPPPSTPSTRTSTVIISDSPLPTSSPLTELLLSSDDDLSDAAPIFSNANLSLPFDDDPGIILSSPIKGRTGLERGVHRRAKAHKARKAETAHTLNARKEDILEDALDYLATNGIRFGDLLDHVFNPANGKGDLYYHEFFINYGAASQILNWWTSSKYSKSANEVRDWAVTYVEKILVREARQVTKSKALQTMGRSIDDKLVLSFSFSDIHQQLSESLTPISMRLITSLATSPRVKEHTEKRKKRTQMVATSAILACLGEYSHANNLSKRMFGLYLYTSGAQKQLITILSTFGICESFTNMTSQNIRRILEGTANESEKKDSEEPLKIKTGTLPQLSESIRARAREVAATGLFASVYDNINYQFKNSEQIIGRHDSQENGTTATITPLFDATPDDINLDEFKKSFLEAEPLKIEDVLHNTQEAEDFQKNLIFTVLRIIVTYGGEKFKVYEKQLKKNQPATKDKIKLHRSELYPLPPWNIDESTITGNAEVDQAIVDELKLKETPESANRVRFQAGDQLSIARLRALELIRAGQEADYAGFFWGAWIAGLFHAKMADTQGTLLTHWGKPNTGARNPGSLWFHNTRLDRLPITTTSLPPFRVCRDLVFVSLYARVLHCLLLVSKCKTLDDYTTKFRSWDDLVKHAQQIYETYANSETVEDLRWARKREEDSMGVDSEQPTNTQRSEGDAVFENALLFMRDALISREFTDAVKAGDSGRVVLVLKAWALSFRGNGRTKYAYEMLHLIHNLEKVWNEKTRRIVLNNWLLNPTGHEESWVEIDLVQEHLNFWIKAWHKAHGVNASWDWLAMIGPCVDVLRTLARQFNHDLGAAQGTKHTPPDLSKDIQTVMDSLDEHGVYQLQKGRVLDEDNDGPAVPDVMAVGLHNLTSGSKNPLSDYNDAFLRLQKRRRMKTVSQMVLELHEDVQTPTYLPPCSTTPSSPSSTTPASAHSNSSGTAPPNTPQSVQASAETSPEDDDGDEVIFESEMGRLIDEIVAGLCVGDDSLTRLTADDVDFDMDMVEVDCLDNLDSESEVEEGASYVDDE